MTALSESPEVELLRRSFEALSRGDFAVLSDALAEDAKWRTVDEGPTNCEGRRTIIEVMSENLAGRLRGSIEETIQSGPRVLVAFRPERPSDAANRPLDGGIAYMVVTVSEGKITELKGCADRAAAIAYAQTGEPRAAAPIPRVQPPGSVVEPAEQRVQRLVPFVKVADVERSDLDERDEPLDAPLDRKSTRLNSSHGSSSYAVFCAKKKTGIAMPRQSALA